MKNRISSFVWGALFIVAGVGFVGNAFWNWNFQIFFDGWWTLFLIVPSAVSIFRNGPKPFAVTMFIIGVLIMLSSLGYFDYTVIEKLILPIIFIVLGVSIISKGGMEHYSRNFPILDREMPKSKYKQEYAAVFSTQTITYNENDILEGIVLNSIFGGMELDLRSCIINRDVVIDCTAVFGGMDIYVPDDINVRVASTPIFGGVSNKKYQKGYMPGVPTVYINAICMFGGVDIK
ncbi:LiaF transmembrane domain-containing protein [[Clostridium] polysaccharolyticum]|uniref:Predicted membrane protein n=1 Tax=[Clostridium] polysaccharolyticum TaxID=29364 RepID=A0A1I0ES69_9FIRM|nr:LiaF domain-containing protein [[Clostridium] polysaccharolyticum]SET48367.1 Predicted membrane protein [[Clostridium] polysaccharolyticum]